MAAATDVNRIGQPGSSPQIDVIVIADLESIFLHDFQGRSANSLVTYSGRLLRHMSR